MARKLQIETFFSKQFMDDTLTPMQVSYIEVNGWLVVYSKAMSRRLGASNFNEVAPFKIQ